MYARYRKCSTKNGQSMLEYTILVIVVLAAFLATSVYIRRGIQGRWKQAVDDLGEQYEPGFATIRMNYILATNSLSQITTAPVEVEGERGIETTRTDTSNSVETTVGTTSVAIDRE